MRTSLKELFKDCIEYWGEDAQYRQAIEELGELVVAVAHYLRRKDSESQLHVVEETADVYLMLNQIMEMVGRERVMKMVLYKANRTNEKLKLYKEEDAWKEMEIKEEEEKVDESNGS